MSALRLHRHDDLVEAMALGILRLKGWGHMEGTSIQKNVRTEAADALDALLEAAVRLEVGKSAAWYPYDKSPHWEATTAYEPNGVDYFPALILRREASDDA